MTASIYRDLVNKFFIYVIKDEDNSVLDVLTYKDKGIVPEEMLKRDLFELYYQGDN